MPGTFWHRQLKQGCGDHIRRLQGQRVFTRKRLGAHHGASPARIDAIDAKLRALISDRLRQALDPEFGDCVGAPSGATKAPNAARREDDRRVTRLVEQWEQFAGQTRAQKDRASRLSWEQCESQGLAKAPRIALEGPEKFRPHGIVGSRCEKDAHAAGPCAECEAARRRFAAAVQREDAAVPAAAEPQTYRALYDGHWRAEALRLMTSGPAGAAPSAAAHSRLAAAPSVEALECDPFERGAGACAIS